MIFYVQNFTGVIPTPMLYQNFISVSHQPFSETEVKWSDTEEKDTQIYTHTKKKKKKNFLCLKGIKATCFSHYFSSYFYELLYIQN